MGGKFWPLSALWIGMLLLEHASAYAYIVLAVLVASQLPRWARSVLAFLRDLDDYRANRPGDRRR